VEMDYNLDPDIVQEWTCMDFAKHTPCLDAIGILLPLNVSDYA
jgi:hypothetical protein